MKQLMTLLVLFSLLMGCKKNQAPGPLAPAPVQANLAAPSLTSQEQQLIGYWIMDSACVYDQAGVKQMGWAYTNSLTCKMDFRNTGSAGAHDLVSGYYQCTVQNTYYSAPNMGEFIIGSQTFYITLITATRLDFIQGSGASTWKYFFHK